MNNKYYLKIFVLTVFVSASIRVYAQQNVSIPEETTDPQPKAVTAGKVPCNQPMSAPSDAIVLFDGNDLLQWESVNGGEAKWPVSDGVVTVNKKLGNIRTKQHFRDFQLHIEWRIPLDVQNGTHTQHRGNSGIFLQGIYEIQVLDSYQHPTYWGGHAGSIYKRADPLVNATNPTGEWNVYDIIYTAPTFKKDGTYRTYPYITVIHNGVLIQNNRRINEPVNSAGMPRAKEHGDGPIILQAHRDKTTSEVSFRNIWIREL